MGFNADDLRFLLSAQRSFGLSGDSVCTLGRLSLLLTQKELDRAFGEYSKERFALPSDRAALFADDLLQPLGFSVHSMDLSDYEDASIIHDLNKPITADLIESFDLVWDGGTLEHVFNFPTALCSAMRMVKIGGHLVLRTPANNQCGHGFYQFSPELFFRVLVPEYGFKLLRIYMTGKGGPYHVADPATVKGRVELLNSEGAMLMVHARKIAPVRDTISPQQSDYVSTWNATPNLYGRIKRSVRKFARPDQIVQISKVLRQTRRVMRWTREARLSNRRLYRPVTSWDVTTEQAFHSSADDPATAPALAQEELEEANAGARAPF